MKAIRDPSRLRRLDDHLLLHLRDLRAELVTTAGAESTRAAGDAIQRVVSEALPELLSDITGVWVQDLSRRAMADSRVGNKDGEIADFDVKTHRSGTAFNRPNIISVRRLADFYEQDGNTFVVVLVSYSVDRGRLSFDSVRSFPVEWIAWHCLTIGLLGWGQLQITNTPALEVIETQSRSEWMLELCERMFAFYPREIEKAKERLEFFRRTREMWSNQ